MAEVSLHAQLSQSRSETVYSTMRMSDRPLKSVTISGNHQTADTDLCGEAGGGGARDGLAGDVASEYRVDRVKEAGLSSSDWSNEQNPRLGHRADCGFVAFNVLNQLRPLPVQNKEIKNFSHFRRSRSSKIIFPNITSLTEAAAVTHIPYFAWILSKSKIFSIPYHAKYSIVYFTFNVERILCTTEEC